MLLNLRKYYRPRSVEAAVRLLEANPERCFVLAGGTHLVSSNRRDIEEVVDLSALRLKNMKQEATVIRWGAMVSLQLLHENPRLKRFAGGIVPAACMSTTVSLMQRNQKTLGGEICADPPNPDLAAVLLALEARIKLISFSMEEKELPIAEFWAKPPRTRAKKSATPSVPGLLVEVIVPRLSKRAAGAFERIAQIPSQPSLLSGAAVVEFNDDKTCSTVRLGLGSYSASACRLPKVESELKGKELTPEAIEKASLVGWGDLKPVSNNQVSADYRRAVAPALVRRLLMRCLKGV